MLTVHTFTMEKFCDLVNAYFYLLQDYSRRDYAIITSEIRKFIHDNKHVQGFEDKLANFIVDKVNRCIDVLNDLGYNYDHVGWNGHEINHFRFTSFLSLYHHC